MANDKPHAFLVSYPNGFGKLTWSIMIADSLPGWFNNPKDQPKGFVKRPLTKAEYDSILSLQDAIDKFGNIK